MIKNTYALTVASQTEKFDASLNVWQVIQEMGTNLEGPLKSFTFRGHTTLPRNQQFDYRHIEPKKTGFLKRPQYLFGEFK